MELLLEKGADVNAQGGDYGNALQAASVEGTRRSWSCCSRRGPTSTRRAETTATRCRRLQLDGHEAVVAAAAREGGRRQRAGRRLRQTPLQAAAVDGHEAVVAAAAREGGRRQRAGQRLRQRAAGGCSRRARGGGGAAAREGGRRQRARADTTATRCRRLQYGGHEAVVELLLEKGADVDAQGGYYGNALQAAADGGHEAVVKLLLEKGADVDAQGGYYGNALSGGCRRGHEAVVKLLLEKGADVECQGWRLGQTPLQAAAEKGTRRW